jgi:protein-tyrosine-phosphatase
VASRGINVSETHVPKRFQEVFRYYGLDPSAHKAVQLSIKDMDEADEVLVMEWQHAFLLAKSFGWRHIKKIKLVDAAQKDEKEIFDPYLLNPIEADRVFASVYERAHICASRLNRC